MKAYVLWETKRGLTIRPFEGEAVGSEFHFYVDRRLHGALAGDWSKSLFNARRYLLARLEGDIANMLLDLAVLERRAASVRRKLGKTLFHA